MTVRRLLSTVLLILTVSGAPIARAEETPPPAPRLALTIEGVTVVMVSANDKLTLFIDRVADNAPAEDADITVALASGKPILLARMTRGLFVGPFTRAGRERDSFRLAVTSADGTGQATGEIVYDDAKPSDSAAALGDLRGKLWIALSAGLIGALGGFAFMRWQRRHLGQRMPAKPPVIPIA